jgi:uncharacterized pyridoxamine 5'-phosphate oxidase family protein
MGGIYLAYDVRVFHMTLTIRCGEPKSANSQFDYHIHQRLHFIHFACEANGKIYFNHIYF